MYRTKESYTDLYLQGDCAQCAGHCARALERHGKSWAGCRAHWPVFAWTAQKPLFLCLCDSLSAARCAAFSCSGRSGLKGSNSYSVSALPLLFKRKIKGTRGFWGCRHETNSNLCRSMRSVLGVPLSPRVEGQPFRGHFAGSPL